MIPMQIRFLADENLDKRIGRGLLQRQPQIDWMTVNDAGIDSLLLAWSASSPQEWIDQMVFWQ